MGFSDARLSKWQVYCDGRVVGDAVFCSVAQKLGSAPEVRGEAMRTIVGVCLFANGGLDEIQSSLKRLKVFRGTHTMLGTRLRCSSLLISWISPSSMSRTRSAEPFQRLIRLWAGCEEFFAEMES